MKPSQAAPVRVSSHIDGHRHPCLYRPFRILDDHFCFQEEELPRSRKSPNFFSAILDYMNTLCQSAHRVDRFCAPFTKIRNGVFTTLRTPFTRLRNLTHTQLFSRLRLLFNGHFSRLRHRFSPIFSRLRQSLLPLECHAVAEPFNLRHLLRGQRDGSGLSFVVFFFVTWTLFRLLRFCSPQHFS